MATASPSRVLVCDNLVEFCDEMRAILEPMGLEVVTELSPVRALERLAAERFDLFITTLIIPEMGGLEIIRRVRGAGNPVPILMITGYGSPRAAIEVIRLGASDYMEKPVEPEELKARVRKLLLRQKSDPPARSRFKLADLVSQDPAMKAIFDMVEAVAVSNSRVLILGETGTGKQLIARALHACSPRRNLPFVEINCAAIPENLLESELFGHERGAFTGATSQRIGRFEEAGAGTLFLDEIGEMSLPLQAKLLRVLQDGKFSRVGGQRTLQSQARVIAATNRDLQKDAAEGRFRSDLFYRLHVISLTLPPLRQRPADIPLLCEHFLKRYSPHPRFKQTLSEEALRALQRYSWPGNVRELENLMERLAVLHPRSVIGLDALPEKVLQEAAARPAETVTYTGTYREARKRFEREYVEMMLRAHGGNMAAAARAAGMDRSQFFRLVRRHKLQPAKVYLPAG
jgi:DNA-binding NtrC family response regulator